MAAYWQGEVAYAFYDSARGAWQTNQTHYAYAGGDAWHVTGLNVQTNVLSWTATHLGVPQVATRGYNYNPGVWVTNATVPFAYFTASATSGTAPTNVWFTDMSIGATSWNWNFGDGSSSSARSPNHVYTTAGVYSVSLTVTGPNGTSTNNRAVTVRGPPTITTQPQSRTNQPGTAASFSVTATGTAPLAYQWRFNGSSLANGGRVSGANTSALVLTGVLTNDTGSYSVVVANAYGSVTSSVAVLTVLLTPDSPLALGNAVNATNLTWSTSGATNWFSQANTTHDGISAARSGAITNSQSTILQTTVTGPGTLSFWWKVSSQTNYDLLQFKVGTTINSTLSGEVNWQQRTVYLGAGVQTLQWVYLKDASGYSGQDAAWLDEVSWVPGGTLPSITVHPVGTSQIAGLGCTLSVAAVGTPTLSYQWQCNGTNLSGATTTNLSLANLQARNAGDYRVIITNGYGSATSQVASITITPCAPVITSQPQSRGAALGQDVGVSVLARGTEPLSYQWLKNGTNVPGATGAGLPLPNFQGGDAGVYQVVVSNALGAVTSQSATLTVSSIIAWGNNYRGATDVPAGTSNAVAVAGGFFQSLALRANGTVAAWGNNDYGATSIPAGLSNVVGVAAGWYHSMALRADGMVVAWGYDFANQVTVPAGLSNVVAVAGGSEHSLALRADGTVAAWGRYWNGSTNVPATVPPGLSNVVAVAAGVAHNLALRGDGTVVAWGWNGSGQAAVPAGLTSVVGVAGGEWHSLGLRADGTVVGWGDNGYGQARVPAGLTNVVAVAAGYYHSLALRADGTVVAWGQYWNGLTNVPVTVPTGLSNAVGIASGLEHFLALVGSAQPTIPQQPLSRAANAGETVTFLALAAGQPTMHYQWQFNGTNLVNGGRVRGANTSALVLTGVLTNDAGSYSVVVTNACGSVTSTVVSLTVLFTPNSPLALANALNNTNLTWSTSGATNWFAQTNTTHDGVSAARSGAITNSQSSTLQTTVAGPGTLSFWWKVSSQTNYDLLQFKVGTTTNSTLSGEVNWQQRTVYLGAGAQTLQWVYLKDASLYSGQDAAWLDEVSWAPGGTLPAIAGQPVGTNLPAGLSYTLSVVAVGTPTLSYQWQFNGTNLPGATATNLSLANLQAGNAGDYQVIITNAFGAVTSQVATVIVTPSAPAITSQPQSRGAALGQDVSVSVAARGTEPLSYQWLKNGTNVPGATGAALPLPNFQAGDAGEYQAVVSNAVGTVTSSAATLGVVPVIGWGYNNYGQTNVPVNATNVVAVAAGFYHNLALRTDGTLMAWGYNGYGQTGVPASAANVAAAAAGYIHSLALRADGTVIGWGYNGNGQTNVPVSAANVVAVAAGHSHNLALRADGTVIGWGYNNYGQTNVPPSATNVTAVAAGYYHNLALRSDGTVIAWGHNTYAQTNVPPSATNVVAVGAGLYHSLALRADGTVIAWGLNGSGQTNVPPSATNVVAVAAGYYHSLAVRADGTVIGWGYNNYGQTNVPAIATNGLAVDAGYYHSLALLASSFSPIVVLPAAQRTAYSGDTVALVAAASGGMPLQYQWRCNGSNLVDGGSIRGARTVALTISGVQTSDSGAYSLVVSNAYGSVTSAVASLTVWALPTITLQPQSQTNLAGTTVNFSVAAAGTGPLAYQWRFNGTNLPGATATNYSIASAQSANAGNYTVVVTNVAGSVTSAVASLTVLVPPAITAQPQSRTNLAGTTASFSVTATGTAPLVYQWRFNGTSLANGGQVSGANTSALVLTGVLTNDAGSYSVVVTNAYGSVTSTVVSLTVLFSPDSPLALANALNNTNLAWSTSGATNWFSQTNTTHDGVSAARSGAITNSQSSTLQTTLTGPGTLSFWWKVSSQTNYDLLQFKVGTTTDSTLSGEVNWQQRIVYLGAGAQTLQWVYLKDASSYSGQDAAWLDEVSWVPGASLTIMKQPAGTNLSAGLSYTLSAAAVGTPTLSYQWQFNGTNLSGAAATNLSLVNLQAGNAGGYRVVITNGYGSATSQVASITITPSAPVITSQPQSRVAVPGQDVAVGVAARGTDPLSYQWLKNGADVPGGTGAALPLPNFQAEDAGVYQVVVSNAVGAITSSGATLGVVPVIAWGYNYYGQTNVPPSATNVVAVASGYYHNLVLRADGTIIAWGSNTAGQTNVPPSATNVVAVAAGTFHSLALRADGTAIAWGNNVYGQTTVPSSATNVVALAAGSSHSLALRADGTAIAWGYNNYGQTTVPASATNVVALAAGYYHNLGVRSDGTVIAWGYNNYGQTNVPPSATNVTAVAAGYYHSLALRADGTVLAWGDNGYGQTNVPPSATNVVAVAAGNYHSLGLRADGTVIAWGFNNYGQTNVPAIATNAVAVAGGYSHSLALLASSFFPTVALPMAQHTVHARDTATLVAAASGGLPLHYQWRCNGTNLMDGGRMRGARTPALTIQSVQAGDAGNYSVVVTNAYGSVTSSVVTLVISLAPSLTGLPENQIAPWGGAVTLGVTALGTLPLSFQWQFNGTNLPGATQTILSLSNLQEEHTGLYSVVVSNAYGVATCAPPACLVVNVPYTMSTLAGLARVSGYMDAMGNSARFYHPWDIAVDQAATLYVADRDNNVVRKITPAGVVSTLARGFFQPGGVALDAGGNVFVADIYNGRIRQVTPSGTVTTIAGSSVSGSADGIGTNASFSLPTGVVSDGGTNLYVVNCGYSNLRKIVRNGQDWVVTTLAGSPAGVTGYRDGVGTNALFNSPEHAAVDRAGNLFVADFQNAAIRKITPEGVVTTIARGSGTNDGFNSMARFGEPDGIAVDSSGTIYVADRLYSTIRKLIPLGTNWAVITVAGLPAAVGGTNDGTGSVARFNGPTGIAVDGVGNIYVADAGNSTIRVGFPSSGAALPTIVTPPQDLVVNAGTKVTLSVTTAGTPPLTYQWQFNGTNLVNAGRVSGASTAALTLTGVQTNDAGNYSVVVTNAYGSVTSSVARVTVIIVPPPVIPVGGLGMGTNGSFQLSFPGLSNLTYSVWASTNLTGWTLLGSATQPTPGQFCYNDATATNSPLRFYRVRSP